MLGITDQPPRRSDRMLAATLVALFPMVLGGRSATPDEVETWDRLRSDYLGVDD